jgi:hypothetical protein
VTLLGFFWRFLCPNAMLVVVVNAPAREASMSVPTISPGRLKAVFASSFLFLVFPLVPAGAQVSISVHGGVHAARLDRPERAVLVPGAGIALEGGKGEATTFGVRVGGWLSHRWGIDGGIAVSNNHSWNGGAPFGLMVEEFETRTVFTSATVRARLTSPTSRLGLNIGAGPALIFHGGSGTSLLTRNTDLGGLVDVAGTVGVGSRLAVTLNLQQYLFASNFAEPYTGQFVGDPVRPAGSQFRHEFVVLTGLSWRP